MATPAQLTIRRDAAFGRIESAVRKLGKATKTSSDDLVAIRHRDPLVEQVMRVEAVADSLDALLKAQAKAAKAETAQEEEQPPVTVETVKAEPLKTTETVEVKAAGVPKGKR